MTIESKYLARFARLQAEGAELFTLPGNRMLVEMLPKEDLKSKGGIILGSKLSDHRSNIEENRALLAVVLMVGTGYVDDDGNTVALDYPPGSVVMISNLGVKTYTDFPGLPEYTQNDIGLTRDSEVHLAFPSVEAFAKAKELLNAKS